MDQSLPARFWNKVNRNGPVRWIIWIHGAGYGREVSGSQGTGSSTGNGKTGRQAIGLLFYWLMGRKPEIVCHKCNNPSCVRPDHLYAGDSETNLIDQMLQRIRKQSS